MPTLCFDKVWQVIQHFGVLFFTNLSTPKTVISNFVTMQQIQTQYLSPYGHPTMFPVDKKTRGQKKPLGQKNSITQMY